MFDITIIGGGPAGLSAALVLGRCRRRVLLVDDEQPRNRWSRGVHGFLGSDGIPPHDLRARGLAALAPYDVTLDTHTVVDAVRVDAGFEVVTTEGERHASRKLLLATGIKDCVPTIPGLEPLYGASVFQCAYCDGWEVRDQPLAAYGGESSCGEFALALTTWSKDVILFTDGHPPPDAEMRARMARHGVLIEESRIAALEGEGDRLRSVRLTHGRRVPRAAMFIHLGQHQRSPLAEKLGLTVEDDELIATHERQKTEIPGLYVAGDASRDVKFAIVAAAQGARAAHAINQELREEDTK